MGGRDGCGDVLRVLRVLSSRRNLELVSLLARRGPLSPREAATVLGLDETEASRRLRRLEEAGLLESAWVGRGRGGGGVKRYRVVSPGLCLDYASLSGREPGGPRGRLEPPVAPARLVGRSAELGAAAGAVGLVNVYGVPGSGRSSLAAAVAGAAGGPVLWLRGPGLSARLFEALVGEFLDSLGAGPEGLEALDATVVVDDADAAGDRGLYAAAAEAASGLRRGGRVVLVTVLPELRRYMPGLVELRLGGLGGGEVAELLAQLGLPRGWAGPLRRASGGLPGLLEAARGAEGLEEAVRRVRLAAGRAWSSLVEALGEKRATMLAAIALAGAPLAAGEAARLCPGCRDPVHELHVLAEAGLVVGAEGGGYVAAPEVAPLAASDAAGAQAVLASEGLAGREQLLTLYALTGRHVEAVELLRSLLGDPSWRPGRPRALLGAVELLAKAGLGGGLIHYWAAVAYAELGRRQEALREAVEALRLGGGDELLEAAARALRSRLLLEEGLRGDALAEAVEALRAARGAAARFYAYRSCLEAAAEEDGTGMGCGDGLAGLLEAARGLGQAAMREAAALAARLGKRAGEGCGLAPPPAECRHGGSGGDEG